MLVLLDTGFDGWPLLLQLRSTGAEFLCRSGARRIPLIIKRLPDGSYLSTFGMEKLPVRIIEAWITVTYQDGTVCREQWRLATSLTGHTRYPARELVDLYHGRSTRGPVKLDQRGYRFHGPSGRAALGRPTRGPQSNQASPSRHAITSSSARTASCTAMTGRA